MFSSLSVGGSGFRLASQSILRSSKSLLSTPCSQQQQKLTTAIGRGRFDLSSRSSLVSRTKTFNNKKFFSTSGKEGAKSAEKSGPGWWKDPVWWGMAGSIAAWGMSGAAIYDSALQGPEVISLTMTPVLMVYSGLFARWAWVVKPRNLSLMYCHIANVLAQTNQLRRALEHKMNTGEEEKVKEIMQQVGVLGGVTAAVVLGGPTARTALTNANLGIVSTIAAADAGPFTVHFWWVLESNLVQTLSFLNFGFLRGSSRIQPLERPSHLFLVAHNNVSFSQWLLKSSTTNQQGTHVEGLHFGCVHVGLESSYRQNFFTTICRIDRNGTFLYPIRSFGHPHQLYLVRCKCCTIPFEFLAFWTQSQGGLCGQRWCKAISLANFCA